MLALFMMAVCSEAFADPYRIALPYPDKQYSKQFEVVGYIPDKPYSIGISYSGGPRIFGPDTTFERTNYSSSSLVIDVAGNAMSYSRLIRQPAASLIPLWPGKTQINLENFRVDYS